MGLAGRRRALGYSQEELAELLGVDRTTVGRWESGKVEPQPPQRRRLATTLGISLQELEDLLAQPRAAGFEAPGKQCSDHPTAGDLDEMIRREFLRILTISGALSSFSLDDADALSGGAARGTAADFELMNAHLWQVYRLARSKGSVYTIIRDQLTTLNEALSAGRGNSRLLLSAAADLFQMAGEVAFDSNRYADAAASYTLAASVSKDADAYDLWACALVRHAYVDMSEQRYGQAAQMLDAAERLAGRGNSSLSTRQWVASVQAEAYAGLGDLSACEHALDRAEKVRDLASDSTNGGWLRFDGTRLAEERGARYLKLGRLDAAEETLNSALHQAVLLSGQSYRRKGVVLADLAAIGARRRDPEQLIAYGWQAIHLARASSSGYIARRLLALCDEFGPMRNDRRVAELGAGIAMLNTP
ncbi:multiprotein-bridging factor 1 family protein [Streptomyces sp. NPDC059985]|uniref:helix-turn-helix domain-containing protein n=1 Tax=Streptomyces sp. NPDC059985 TaxID=3347025 RepID=UPI0036BABEA0